MASILNEIRFYAFQWKMNFRNKRVLGASFWLVIVGMILSHSAFYIIWIRFSQVIGTVNGWGAIQTFGMLSVNMLAFGLCHTAFGSTRMLQPKIQTGAFDGFLNKPKNLYVRILNNDSLPHFIGDLIQGVVGLIIFFGLTRMNTGNVALILLMLPPAVIVQISFLMTTDCINFWWPQASLHRPLNELLMATANQPLSLLGGPLRIFYIVFIPALLIAGLPVELITRHAYALIAIAYAVSLGWLALSVWVLKVSVRRYESGNVIG